MKLLIAVGVIALIAIIGSRLIFLQNRLPLGIRHLLITGTEYVLIGILLGNMGLNILDPQTIKDLEPFLIFGLCWIGFMFGLQFEIRLLRSLPRYYFTITLIQSLVTFLVVISLVYLVLWLMIPLPYFSRALISITLGSMASCTAQSAVAIINKNFKVTNRGLLGLLRYVSSVDGLFALLFFTLALSIMAGLRDHSFYILSSLRWLFISILAGLIPGLILTIISRTRFTQSEYMVFVLGTIMFCGGLAFQLGALPLVSGLVCGIFTANFCRHRIRALSIVVHSEKSIYIILLLLIGAILRLNSSLPFVLIVVYIILRVIGKLLGIFIATRLFKPQYPVPGHFGLSLIADGGVAAAIALDISFLYSETITILIPVLIVSLFVNELMAPWFIRRLLISSDGKQNPGSVIKNHP